MNQHCRTLLPAVLLCASLAGAEAPAAEDSYDRVSFAVSAERDVTPDTLTATMFVELEGQEQAVITNDVNRTMRLALDRCARVPSVNAKTLAFSTQPVYQNSRIVGWRSRQSLELASTDIEAITALVGQLQDKLAIGSLAYSVSRDRSKAITDELLDEALAEVQTRAQHIAGAFSRGGYRLVAVDIGQQNQRPPMPMMRMERALSADAAPPAVAPGEQTIALSVQATIELSASRP